jgi:hypothetical protein
MRLTRRSIAAIALSAAALVTLTVAATAAASGDPGDPATAPIPQYDYGGPSKSFLVQLNFGATSATVVSASVGGQRSVSHLADPPLLRLSLTAEDGTAQDSFNAWDPRIAFEEKEGGGEHAVTRDAPGTLTVPYNPDTATMLVHDQRAGTDLATVDLRPAVHTFCVNHPTDPSCVDADLSVTSTTASGSPLGIVGQSVTVHVTTLVANLGPGGPVDANVTQTVSGSTGVTVAPATRTVDVGGLAVGGPVTVTRDYQVACTGTNDQTVTVTTAIAPRKAKVADLNPANNSSTATFPIDCAVPVAVNVLPGSERNPVVVLPGLTIPIVVLTTNAGEYGLPLPFDAATIQAATVRMGVRDPLIATNTGTPDADGQIHLEFELELDERTRDRDKDAELHGRVDQMGIQNDTTEICVRGRFGPGAGTTFFGCDHITVLHA